MAIKTVGEIPDKGVGAKAPSGPALAPVTNAIGATAKAPTHAGIPTKPTALTSSMGKFQHATQQGLGGNQEAKAATLQLAQMYALGETGNQLISDYFSGKLPPAQQAELDQALHEQTAEVRQTFASLGLSGSTMEASAIAQVKSGILVSQAQMLQQEYDNALNALNLDQGMMQYFASLHVANIGADTAKYGAKMELIGSIFQSLGGM